MALVFFLANHVSVGPSLVDAVSDHVYLSFFEPEKGSKREKTLTVESNPNISISDKYVHRLLLCMFVRAKCTHR